MQDELEEPTPRQLVIEALGTTCVECGWAKDPRVLRVIPLNPGVSTDKLVRKYGPARYYGIILDELDHWKLLCPNCAEVRRYVKAKAWAAAAGAPEAPTAAPAPMVIWRTEIAKASAVGSFRYSWLDKHLNEGRRVYIMPREGGTYEYPSGEEVVLTGVQLPQAQGVHQL